MESVSPDTGWTCPTKFPDLSGAPWISLDTETKDPDLLTKGPGCRRPDSHIVGISVAVPGKAFYFPMRHEGFGDCNLPPDQVLKWASDTLGNPEQPKFGANLMYDLDFLASEGVVVRGKFYDVMTAEPLIDENLFRYDLDSIAKRRVGEGKKNDALYHWCAATYGGEPNSKQRKNIWRAPPSLVGPYAEADAYLPKQIFDAQWKIIQEQDLEQIFRTEQRLIPMLLAMRQRGVRVDLEAAGQLDHDLTKQMEILQNTLPSGIEIWAAETIATAFDGLGLKYPRTGAGKPSFRKDWLMNHANPIAQTIGTLRRLDKAKGTFVSSYILGHEVNGRIHAEFIPLKRDTGGAVSGRFASANPNLQNVPIRDKQLGALVRSLFLPDPADLWH